jgi:hypothetical protein
MEIAPAYHTGNSVAPRALATLWLQSIAGRLRWLTQHAPDYITQLLRYTCVPRAVISTRMLPDQTHNGNFMHAALPHQLCCRLAPNTTWPDVLTSSLQLQACLQASSGAVTSLGTVSIENLATTKPDVFIINGQVG